MHEMNTNYVYFNSVEKDFEILSLELDEELTRKKGELQSTYNQFNKLTGINDVIIAYVNSEAVGCAAIKFFDKGTFEVKRVFVKEKFRGFGIATEMMIRIEDIAKEKGLVSLIVETYKDFSSAINLYKKLSYEIIENYGQYKDMEKSICMRKIINDNKKNNN
jgi:GNAT superfamily N-acetyltransferase